MSDRLELPYGVRFPLRSELQGPRAERDRLWAQIEQAALRQGFVARSSDSPEFETFIEANVDATRVWAAFRAVADVLFADVFSGEGDGEVSGPAKAVPGEGPVCQLLFADADAELAAVGLAPLGRILALLDEIQYQLVHDGWIHFGLVREREGRVSGVIVTPTKHLQIWAQDQERVAGLFLGMAIEELSQLDFLASYPVVVDTPPEPPEGLRGAQELQDALRELLGPE